jgi:Ca-activated chloride channel homolog
MSETLHQFHFLAPMWLWALVALPAIIAFGFRRDATRTVLSRLVDADLLPHLLRGQPRRARAPTMLFATGWMLCSLALAGPTWSRVSEQLSADRAAQVVAISLSQHMLARDQAPDRMERARYKAKDLLTSNADGLNALIGYAGQSFVVAPLTTDAHSLDDLLNAMGPDTMPVDGDNAAQAIEQGTRLIGDAKVDGGSLVLITDDANVDAQAAARKALVAGVHVSVLGVGTTQGTPIPLGDGSFLRGDNGAVVLARRNDGALAALAAAGGGRYTTMTDDSADVALMHDQLHVGLHAAVVTGQFGDAWQDRGPWLLLPLVLIAAFSFRRGWLLCLPLVLLPCMTGPAHAGDWRDWWQRPDQQAANALRNGDAAKAQKLATDPALRGVAAYRAGHYASAVDALQSGKSGDSQYNLGNAQARLGHYPEAIQAYDQALKRDPQNEDARFNRQIVEHAMRKPPENKSSSSTSPSQGASTQGQNGQSGKEGSQNKGGQNKQENSASDGKQNQQGQQGQQNHAEGQRSSDRQPPSKSDNAQSQNKDEQAKSDAANPATPIGADQQAQTDKAKKALQQQLDKQLGARRDGAPNKTPSNELGAESPDDALSKLPVDVRRALQRVPDDPGALLRRKFQLEYQERQNGMPTETQQP